jgi:RHS repeat-associated protein
LTKTYIYANSEILAQHDGDASADRYFCLHDRLGSVRLVIDDEGAVQNYYTYEPFGQTIESGGTLDNPFRFTGQYFDSEIEEYYLRARQYNPHLARFTSRDPVSGKFREPLSLHRYLYCNNDPIDRIDPDGQFAVTLATKLVVGGIVGGITGGLSAYRSSGGEFWSTGFGIVTGAVAGAFSAVVPQKILATVVGSILSGANSAFAEYRQHGNGYAAGMGFLSGMGGGILSATFVGHLGILGQYADDFASTVAFVGGQATGLIASELYGSPIDGVMKAKDFYDEHNKDIEEFDKRLREYEQGLGE